MKIKLTGVQYSLIKYFIITGIIAIIFGVISWLAQ